MAYLDKSEVDKRYAAYQKARNKKPAPKADVSKAVKSAAEKAKSKSSSKSSTSSKSSGMSANDLAKKIAGSYLTKGQSFSPGMDEKKIAANIAKSVLDNPKSSRSRNILQNLGISLDNVVGTATKSKSQDDGMSDRATAEAMKELHDAGILSDEEMDDDEIFESVKKRLDPVYKKKKDTFIKKWKIEGNIETKRIEDDLKKIASDKDLYLEKYYNLVDDTIEKEAKTSGRTKEDLASDLERSGILGERERENIREGFNASGRFKSSERVEAELQSVDDQKYTEEKLKTNSNRTIEDVMEEKKDTLRDLDLLKRGQITDLEFRQRQSERDKKYGSQLRDIEKEEGLQDIEADRISGIGGEVDRIRSEQIREEDVGNQRTLDEEEETVDPYEEVAQMENSLNQ